MSGEKPVRILLPESLKGFCVCLEYVAVFCQSATGWLRVLAACDLYKAHAAYGMARETWMIAKSGDMHTGNFRRIKQGGTFTDFDPSTVHRNHDH